MKRVQSPFAFIVVALLTSASILYAAEEDPKTALDSAVTSSAAEAKDCIPLSSIRSTRVLDNSTILFQMNGGETLVNNLPHPCPSLGMEKAFGYETSLSQLCSTDIIWVVRQTAGRPERGASCGLGKFEPYVAPDTTDEAASGATRQLKPM